MGSNTEKKPWTKLQNWYNMFKSGIYNLNKNSNKHCLKIVWYEEYFKVNLNCVFISIVAQKGG